MSLGGSVHPQPRSDVSITMLVDDEPVPGVGVDGRPDPGYARDLGLVPAPGGRRSAAFALDALVWTVLAVPGLVGTVMLFGVLADSPGGADAAAFMLPLVLVSVSQGLLVIFGFAQLILHGRRGVTLGKAAFGIRSVQVATFGPAGFWRVVLRVLVLWGAQVAAPFAGPAVLFASSTWDPEARGRSWLDRVGRCYAIDVRNGLDPFDAKALRHARRTLAAPPSAGAVRLPSLATDRPLDEHTFIPAARSSSGVVAAAGSGWEPPPLGAPAVGRSSSGLAVPDAPMVPAAPSATPPAGAERPASTAIPDRSTWFLAFDDGTKLAAPDRGFVGRAPAPPGGEPGVLVPLVDTSMRISKTHAEIGVDASGVWISDRGSRNGTAVEMPDGAVRTLGRGQSARLPAGSRVTLGGRSFTVSIESGGLR